MPWLLERGRIPLLLLAAVLTAFFGYQCLSLKVERDNHSMTADNPQQSALEERFHKAFGEGDSIFVAVSRERVLDEQGRLLVRQLADGFAALKGVRRVVSLADTNFAVPPALVGMMISEDESMTGIRLLLEDFDDDGESLTRIVESVTATAKQHSKNGTRIAVSGLPIQKYEVGKLVRKDQRLFAPLSLLVLGAVLLIITRQISGMVFPLLVSALSICWTLGLYAWFGNSLNVITSLLPPVIMTLSVTTTIHIYLEWLRSPEQDRRRRISESVRKLYRPCLFASATTAIGFLSLAFSSSPAVRSFGVFAAIGIVIAYVLGVAGLAIGLSFLKAPKPCKPQPRTTRLDHGMAAIGRLSVNRPWRVIALTLILGAVGVVGLMRVETDTDLLHFLGNNSALVEDTEFIDGQLAGVSTIEWLIEKADGKSFASLDEIRNFQAAVNDSAQIRQTLSVADLIAQPGIPPQFPGNAYLSADRQSLRLTVCTDVIGTQAGDLLAEQIRRLADEHLGGSYEVHPLGGFYRVITESNQIVASQIRSFAIAISLILLAIGIVFRSLRYTLLAIVPNVIPLLLVGALMGFSGIALSTGTVMIASVVMGIGVDDTIHYLSAYLRSKQWSRSDGIVATTRSIGFVLFASTMALSAGFWVAIFGSFQPTIYFALLTGVTMWFALLCDLLVLPALLRIAAPRHPHHST